MVEHFKDLNIVQVNKARCFPVLDQAAALWRCQVFQESLQVVIILVNDGIWRKNIEYYVCTSIWFPNVQRKDMAEMQDRKEREITLGQTWEFQVDILKFY